MRRIWWSAKLLAIVAVAVLGAAAASLLPDDPYMRFATLDRTIQNRSRWIYERINFDPAPIDVAIIGPSRSGAAVAGPRLEADLAALGQPLRAANLSLPENGRDINWVILDELLTNKHPRLVVIGVIEKPSRLGHPAYKYVASAAKVVDPAYFGNLNYLSNLIYLPYRQLRLAVARIVPSYFDLPTRFDPAFYRMVDPDTTTSFTAADGHIVHRDLRVTRADLAAQAAVYEHGVNPPRLGTWGRDIEFGDERTYTARMVRLAHNHGARVAFLFLPYYTGPHDVQERDFYQRLGQVLDASFVSRHDEWYSDVAHLNHAGALMLTDWLAPQVKALAASDFHEKLKQLPQRRSRSGGLRAERVNHNETAGLRD